MNGSSELLRELYDVYNRRDLETVLAWMCADVDWPNAREGGRVHGRDAVREYWTRQWEAIDPTVEPVAITTRPDGSIAVAVRQVARAPDGTPLTETDATHVFRFRDGLIARMEIEL